jgi:ribonucleotide reductase alpha subunit
MGMYFSIQPIDQECLFQNISSGIEPIYSLESTRKILLPNGESVIVNLRDYAYSEYKNNYKSKKTLPKYFSTSENISPKAHIMIQSVTQEGIDGRGAQYLKKKAEAETSFSPLHPLVGIEKIAPGLFSRQTEKAKALKALAKKLTKKE